MSKRSTRPTCLNGRDFLGGTATPKSLWIIISSVSHSTKPAHIGVFPVSFERCIRRFLSSYRLPLEITKKISIPSIIGEITPRSRFEIIKKSRIYQLGYQTLTHSLISKSNVPKAVILESSEWRRRGCVPFCGDHARKSDFCSISITFQPINEHFSLTVYSSLSSHP